MLTADALNTLPHVRHGFFTREGGISKGIYLGLNCGMGSDDDKGAVIENRARVAAKLDVAKENLLTVHQIHSANVIHVSEPWQYGDAPKGDAMVTTRTDVALGVLAADCTPVLFADSTARVIGAAHSGWKGAFTGVLEATIDTMIELGARRENIIAAIGPCISREAYEVGPEFRERFLDASPANDIWFTPSARDNHFMFDLTGYVAHRLNKTNIKIVARLDRCTYADEARFFSYRRTIHRGEPDYGRQMSAIALTPDA